MMKSLATVAAAVFTWGFTYAATVYYDPGYDQPGRSMDDVACSDGPNGLITKYGWQNQSQIPKFPYIGASDRISGWNSPECGVCLEVTTNETTIIMLAIDHADDGIVISEAAMTLLAQGNTRAFGKLRADVFVIDSAWCGL